MARTSKLDFHRPDNILMARGNFFPGVKDFMNEMDGWTDRQMDMGYAYP